TCTRMLEGSLSEGWAYRLGIGEEAPTPLTSGRRSRAATASAIPSEAGTAPCGGCGLVIGQLFHVEGWSSEPRSESTIASVAVAQTTPSASTMISGRLPMLVP